MTDFFIHIPRSGGSSLRTLLSLNYSPEKIYSHSGDPQQILDYVESPLSERKKFDLVQGHFPFGLHLDLEVFRYFALIRDPIERHFSEFFYAKKYPEHHAHERIKSGDLTLDWWAEIGEHHAFYHQNTLCQFLSGDYMVEKPTPATFQAACSNLEKMNIFGITERFTESALMISKYMNWKKPIFGSRNRINSGSDVPENLINKAKKYQQLDLALYEFACELFEKRLQNEGKVIFNALDLYNEEVERIGHLEQLDQNRFTVDQDVSTELIEANKIKDGSGIWDYILSPKSTSLFSEIPFRSIKPSSAATFYKSLLAFLTLGEIKIFNRTQVRSHWLGLIDVKEFPRISHPRLGFFIIESDFSKKYPFKLLFEDEKLESVETNPWIFPHCFSIKDRSEIRFLGLNSKLARVEKKKDDGSWELIAEI